MRTVFIAGPLVLAICIGINAGAQPPAPRPGGPPPGPGPGQLQQVTAFQGRVTRLATNDDYEYDGFYLQTGQDSLLVKFPPHLGGQLTPLLRAGTAVTANGTLDYPPFGGKEVRMVSLIVNGQTIFDTPPTASPAPPADSFVSGRGRVSGTQTDREGRMNGLLLDNKTILRIPLHIAYQLVDIAKNGSQVEYSGMQKMPQPGEAAADNFKIVTCNTISINGQQYLVR